MQVFKDGNGKDWALAIKLSGIERVRDCAGIDLLDGFGLAAIPTLLKDDVAVAKVAYALCKPQADAAGIGRDDFIDAVGPVVEAVADAILEELELFIQSPTERARFKQMADMTRVQVAEVEATIARAIDSGQMTAEMAKELDPLRALFGDSSGELQESSA